MTQTRNEYFDSGSLARMETALDEAYRALPAAQQTPEMKIALARAIVYLTTQGELDPALLSSRALGLVATGDRLDFEVLSGGDTIATCSPSSTTRKRSGRGSWNWRRPTHWAAEIRVTDQSGAMVALWGRTALRFGSVALGGSSYRRPATGWLTSLRSGRFCEDPFKQPAAIHAAGSRKRERRRPIGLREGSAERVNRMELMRLWQMQEASPIRQFPASEGRTR